MDTFYTVRNSLHLRLSHELNREINRQFFSSIDCEQNFVHMINRSEQPNATNTCTQFVNNKSITDVKPPKYFVYMLRAMYL